jgi:subtilisin family serine protease
VNIKITAALLFLAIAASAQQIGDGVYWVYFTDKNENGYRVDQPGEFLSDRSIQRRAWQGLAVDLRDEPVTQDYIEQLEALGADIRHVSRWLNGVVLVNATRQLYDRVLEESFADSLPWLPESEETYYPARPSGARFSPPLSSPPDYQYGVATQQVMQLDMEILHQKGYTGAGVWIGLLDAGFRNVDTLPSFKRMIATGRLLGTRNFVNDSSVFSLVNNHGMYVLSIIGAEWDGRMLGTAPHASYFLCSTENIHQETRIEEIAWIEAAEFLDSLGVDVLNTSLGYSDFDTTLFDYTYSDMDGKTTYISRAASMTASRGMITCISAGNQGNKPWYRITAAADAFDILSVGAVDSTGQIGKFSSRGPSFDGRVKPDVVAMGVATGIQYIDGNLARGSGTSFSSPLIAGSVASLWQAYPELPAREMIFRIRETGNRYLNPDATYGYGIPSFARAFWMISSSRSGSVPSVMDIYPNPASQWIRINLPEGETGNFVLQYYDMSGRRVWSQSLCLPGETQLPENLGSGLYILEIRTSGHIYRNRLIKE